MILVGEDLPEIHYVSERLLQTVFDESETDFGKFLVLAKNEGCFIQTANLWEPTPECTAFQQRTQSDPYSLEYKDESTGDMFAAENWQTLQEIKTAFLAFLKGSESWKAKKAWTKIEY